MKRISFISTLDYKFKKFNFISKRLTKMQDVKIDYFFI